MSPAALYPLLSGVRRRKESLSKQISELVDTRVTIDSSEGWTVSGLWVTNLRQGSM